MCYLPDHNRYPLLLNRLYKVTAYHHKDREALRDAQLKVELHLEHINQQTKGVGATNKIWRRISNLSAPMTNRRGLINADDIGYIKLRKTAMDMLKWDRDETQFIHSGRLNFAPLNEYLTKQKMKPLRYMAAHALLMVHGKPNWKYRPDLVKSNLDSKLMTPTVGGNGIKEAALLLFREKNGRFVPCREPLFLSNCVLSTDCSVYNSECPLNQPNHHTKEPKSSAQPPSSGATANINATNGARKSVSSIVVGPSASPSDSGFREGSADSGAAPGECGSSGHTCNSRNSSVSTRGGSSEVAPSVVNNNSNNKEEAKLQSGDTVSMSSLKSLAEEQSVWCSPPAHTSRSFSLASALPKTQPAPPTGSTLSLSKQPTCASSNSTILNQLMTKVNSYHHHQSKQPAQAEQASRQPGGAVVSSTASLQQQQQQQSGAQQQNQRTEGSTGAQMTNNEALANNKSASSGSTSLSNQQQTTTTTSAHALTGTTCHANSEIHQHYSHHYFHNHHQPYGDFEESFEIHERLSKESMLLRADTPLKTRYWLQMLRYHAKDLGQWRQRRHALANIMMMRQE